MTDDERLDGAFADVRAFIDAACGGKDFRDILDQSAYMFSKALNSGEHDWDDMLTAISSVADGAYMVSGSRDAAVAMAACAMMRVAVKRKKKPCPVADAPSDD